MPQPGNKVKWNGKCVFTDIALNKSDLTKWIPAVINGWAMTEAQLGRIFVTLLEAKNPIAQTLYTEFTSYDVQARMLNTLGANILPEADSMLLSAILEAIRPIANRRNQFAHWVWGVSVDPDLEALVLLAPKHWIDLTATQIEYARANEDTGPWDFIENFPNLDRKHLCIYRLSDLQNEKKRADQAFVLTENFRRMVQYELGTPIRQQIYHLLTHRPRVRRCLARIERQRGLRT